MSGSGQYVQLKIWHPDCWTLQITNGSDGGLLGHGVYTFDNKVKGRFTAYAKSEVKLERLIEAVRGSDLTDSVWLMDHQRAVGTDTFTPGNATRSLLVEYDWANSISNSLISRGFIPDKPVWIHDGHEYWSVIVDENRQAVEASLEAVRNEMSAEIEIQQLVSDDRASQGLFRTDILTNRQREIFELAREHGYYNWPREISASELAKQVDISKATLVEHLRKAEAKLIDSIP